jgi:hypothetical protein
MLHWNETPQAQLYWKWRYGSTAALCSDKMRDREMIAVVIGSG